jgi:polyhydroxyalkanoate synthesis regulator phasin
MEDLFKKLLYTGVGLVAVGAEKVQKTVDQLISEDKLTVEEGKKIVDEFVSNTESKKEEFESQLRLITEKVVKGFSFATTKDLEALAARVEALENKSKTKKEVTA